MAAKNTPWLVAALGVLAVVFNPILPIYLNRSTWAPIDVLAGLSVGISGFRVKDDSSRPPAESDTA